MSRPRGLDVRTRLLVEFAALVAVGEPDQLVDAVPRLRSARVPPRWVEELLLQSLLMVGYPLTLVAFGIWRKGHPSPAPIHDPDAGYDQAAEWRVRGEVTCAKVYGDNYRRLRENVRDLHPALEEWMVTEGYGRTLSRPGLDLLRRELCTVVQVAVLGAARQLHSHLRGALNAGATPAQVEAALGVVNPLVGLGQWRSIKKLWRVVKEG